MRRESLTRLTVRMAAITAEGWIVCATNLEILHAVEQPVKLLRSVIVIESGAFERDEDFVRGLERGEATGLGLLLDDITTRRGRREHHSWQTL